MTVSGADVARAAGVSRAAVSQILNGKGERFAAETRARVLEVAQAMAYRPAAAGRALRRGTSDVVVALVGHTTFGGHHQDLIDALSAELAQQGLLLVVRYAGGGPTTLEPFLAALQPAALLSLSGLTPDDAETADRVGVVLVGRPPAGKVAGPGAQDEVGSLQAQHLYERGHRTLAYARVRDSRQDLYGSLREEGFRHRADELGLPTPRQVLVTFDVDGAVADTDLPTPVALGCYNDDVALALLHAAHRTGRRVPAEVALVGVDDTVLGRSSWPRLTSIGYDITVIARTLAARTFAALGIESPLAPPPIRYVVRQGETT
ncbi:LacI family DNA-binding transcriptional regulator [Cellulomonas endophytica]|uniref:LacI family DNA-binding transcriptional regulator n=1 Tax=Cellulomonas endophytica TaxID=2494735 RepID=UPI0013E90415|nr:LacI family DNA-binding transcriptional regulator [Cellulomonas endophytica]